MEQAPAGIPIAFEVTYQAPDLDVAMSVYDVTGSPTLVQGPTALTNIAGTNTYVGDFTPDDNKNYLIIKAVYTDNTFTTVDNSFAQGSETITTQAGNGGGGANNSSCELVGQILNNNPVVGYVEAANPVVGFIDC